MSLQSQGVPITSTERIEWARLALEEAVGRLAADRFRGRVFVEAAIARHAELHEIRESQRREDEAMPRRGRRAEVPFHR